MTKYSSFKYGGAKYGANKYKINNTDFILQPSVGRWLPRALIDYDGNGRAIYEPYRTYEIGWNAISPSDFDQLQNWYVGLGVTGSITASLPIYGTAGYGFTDYFRCLLQEPEIGSYFNENILNARMLVTKIRT